MNRQSFAFLLLWLTCVFHSVAEETFERVTIGTNTYQNVRIIQSTPIDLLIGHDEGFKRIPLQNLPESLKAKYPYDAQKAAAFEKEKADESRSRQSQSAASVRGSLLQKEQQLRAKLEPMEKEMNRLKANITTVDRKKRGKGTRSADRREADALRDKKLALRDQLWKLRDELQRTEELRKKYE